MKLRIYLDTSVFSARFDERMPERQAQTCDFWHIADSFVLCTSGLTRQELEKSTHDALRSGLEDLFKTITVHEITEETRALARWYVEVGVFSPLFFPEAMHVAACVLTKQQIFLSWDFKRLVNRRTRFLLNETNASANLPRIDILPPPEL